MTFHKRFFISINSAGQKFSFKYLVRFSCRIFSVLSVYKMCLVKCFECLCELHIILGTYGFENLVQCLQAVLNLKLS